MTRFGGTITGGLLVLLASGGAALALAFPRAEITAGPSGETPETAAAFHFRTTERATFAHFECSLDGARWSACTSPVEHRNLGGGGHDFAVRLVGALADPTPARRTWVVERRTEVTACDAPGPCANPAMPAGETAPSAPPVQGDAVRPRPDAKPIGPSARRDARGCAHGANQVGEVRDARIVAATICLLNRERAARGLRAVRSRPRLARAASRHAQDMVTRGYFAHASRGGHTVLDRVKRTGYLRGARYWTLGEVLAWGTRKRSTPDAIVRAWMQSPGHRVIVLRPGFRDVGVDVVRGTPHPRHVHGGTFVAEFGRRG